MPKREKPLIVAGVVMLAVLVALAMPACDREPEVADTVTEPGLPPVQPDITTTRPEPQPSPRATAPEPATTPGDTAESMTPGGDLRVGGEMPEPEELQPETGSEPGAI